MKARILIIIFAATWAALPADATTLVRMSLSQLSQASSTIVQGYVLNEEAQWNQSHTRIMTFTTLALDHTLKGQPPSTLTIAQPGGTIGNFHVHVPGTAYLRLQAEYILFLEPGGTPQTFHVVGMVQGAFRIVRKKNGSERWVILPLGALSTGSTGQSLVPSPSLGEFQTTISGLLRAPIIIPSGTLMPVLIESTEFHGAGQVSVVARTTSDLFPSKAVVIPTGSEVEGVARRVGEKWKICWTSVSVRGRRAKITGTNEVPEAGSLQGSSVVVKVR
jgi:hypothetical protein